MIKLAKVVNVNPKAHSVDVVMCDTGMRVPNVQVLSGAVTSNTGRLGIATPTAPKQDYDIADTGDRDVYAYVAFAANIPVVVGFKVPEICQMTFDRPGFLIDRHESDWYTSVDKDGNFEASHPSGTYFKVGTSSAHEDLAGQDFDKKWKIAKNTDKAVHVCLTVKNAGSQVASLDIDPSGNVTLTHTGNLSVHTTGNASVTVDGNMTSSAASWAHSGNITVTGTVTASVDVVGGGKSLKTHTHSGVQTGGGTSGPPS
jgi:hypothetical protein